MKQVCLFCERTALDRNLYCQETYCPAEMSPLILDFGEWFGDIEIIRPIVVLRSAVLYEAVHQKQRVYLKVAHPGTENKERLKREAEFLQHIQLKRKRLETLPHLLPPYANTTIAQDAYGKTMLGDHLLYFYLFDYVEGETLRDLLVKNAQLWINHVGWIMISLATTVNFLHLQGLYDFGLCPEGILIRFDEKQNVPRVVLFDLGIACTKDSLRTQWYPSFVHPSYTAPELMANAQAVQADYRTDVYGLGLLLYELLVGEPVYTFRLRSDADIYQAVRENQRVIMNRVEDVEKVAGVALQAVDPQMSRRQPFAADFAEQLKGYFGRVPDEKKRRRPQLNTILVVLAALLAIAFLVTLAVSLINAGG